MKETVQWTKKVPALITMPGTFKGTLWQREQATNSNTLAFYPVLLSLCNFPAANLKRAAGFPLGEVSPKEVAYMKDPITDFLVNVASDASGGQVNQLLGVILRTYLSTTWGQSNLQFLYRQGKGSGRWLANSPVTEKLAVLFGLCYFSTAYWSMAATESLSFEVQLVIATVTFPVMVYGIYLTARDLKRWVVRRVRGQV